MKPHADPGVRFHLPFAGQKTCWESPRQVPGKTASFTLPMITLLAVDAPRARNPTQSGVCVPRGNWQHRSPKTSTPIPKHLKIDQGAVDRPAFRSASRTKLIDKGDVLIATPGRLD